MLANRDFYHQTADCSGAALLIIDMINDLEFPGGDLIFDSALAAAKNIAALRQRARQVGIPVIFANDNFGRWRSNFKEAVEHCLNGNVRGQALAETVCPADDDYFILKPKHSAFYATPLQLLLQDLRCRRLILCGISGSMCVQFTAVDAYVREFEILVPRDCIASNTDDENQRSLQYIEDILGADTTISTDLDLNLLHRDP